MSNLLQIQNASKQFGSKQIFDQANLSINTEEHVAVIGPNGAGKTTLFKLITGQLEFDNGACVRSRSLRIGYLSQEDEWNYESTLEEHLEKECVTPIWDLKAIGLGLGLTEEHFASNIKSFSGGYRMRCQLLYLIGMEPNLMLLDEPTNYLDLESLIVLENFLIEYSGAFLLISHDRAFLKRVATCVVEVDELGLTKYPGDIDDYFEQKALVQEQLSKEVQASAAKRKEILDFVSRFGAKATKAKQAQSRLKQLNRMEVKEVKPLPITATIKIPPPVQTGKLSFELKRVDLGYGDKKILSDVNLEVLRGHQIGVVGSNGAGKSTLLKAIAGRLEPQSGERRVGLRCELSYFAQHVTEELSSHHSVFDSMMGAAHPDLSHQDVRDMAGSLLFSGSDIDKKVKVLSGGEKSRVALGCMLLTRRPVLVLDEPTNHLDFSTVEALTQALSNYTGTIIVVSHDRDFISRISNKILVVDNGKVDLYPGSYHEYVWSVQQGIYDISDDKKRDSQETKNSNHSGSEKKSGDKKANRKQRALERQSKARVNKLEKDIETSQIELKEKTALFSSCDASEYQALSKECKALEKSIQAMENEWLELSESP